MSSILSSLHTVIPFVETPKDPGIPNNFPFKDQVLAEVSEQRRMVSLEPHHCVLCLMVDKDAEEKQRKKEERKTLRAQMRGESFIDGLDEEAVEGESEDLTGLQVGNDAIGGIGARMLINVQALKPPRVACIEDEEDQVPFLIRRDVPTLRAVLDESDVVIQVLDARDPLPFRSLHIEEFIASKPGKQILLVLNKIGEFVGSGAVCLLMIFADACPRESIVAWAASLRTQYPTFLFRSASAFLPSGSELTVQSKGKGKAKLPADDGLGVDSVLAYLGERARAKNDSRSLAVAVLGITNV